MAAARILTRPTRTPSYARSMPGDILAILLALAAFAALYLIMEAIDRI
jgi:hypothetical protein